jgi:hypothetical protein
MPIQTNLNVAPYYDDFDGDKDFYRILFRPGVAVQARELNQLQTILQKQVERFGDNIFKTGTIIDGCQFVFHSELPYVKIKDNEATGAPAVVSAYEGLYVKNSANVFAIVVKTVSGYESTDNPNTLYVKYVNSGTNTTTSTFAADEVLTVYDVDNIIFKVNIGNGSAGYSDSDSVVFLSALAVQNTTGGTTFTNNFQPGDRIYNGVSANAVITAVDTTSNAEVVILKIRPYANNLAQANSVLWTFASGESILSANASPAEGTIVDLIGSGAAGTIVTDNIGKVARVAVTSNGRGYYVPPTVWVSTTSANTLQIAATSLTPQTYLTQLTVAESLKSPVGLGYGMTIKEGVIYQKGYFSRVDEQLIVVEKYNTTPDEVVVGFDTAESIINSNIDSSLLDNALGTYNYTAPGADRLKLTPQLTLLSKSEADANAEFLAIVEFADGFPYKQNRQTQYSIIGEAMAERTFDESGNYVLDSFNAATKSTTNIADEPNVLQVVVDPGKAYIDGYKVETLYNAVINVDKANTTRTSADSSISMNYGNYIIVKEVGGMFNFSAGDQVELYDTARAHVTSFSGDAISTGSAVRIGYAKIRHMLLDSGIPGSGAATYRLYLFDVKMDAGRNFQNVKAVYYPGTVKGIADVVQTLDRTTNAFITTLYDNQSSRMLFGAGREAVKNLSGVTYTYGTSSNSVSANTLGQASIVLTTSGETFAYSGTLTAADRTKVLIVPNANAIASANITGNIGTSTSTTSVTGTGTDFVNELEAGDFIKFGSTIKQIASITNATAMTLTSTAGVTGSSNAQIYFPQFVPISMANPIRNANVSVDGQTLTLDLGVPLSTGITLGATYQVTADSVAPKAKTIQRNTYTRVDMSSNIRGATGPWSLGFPDVIRLRSVHLGANNTFDESGAGVVDVTNNFYVETGHTTDTVSTSSLKRKPSSTLALTTSSRLLVKFDHLTTTTAGMRNIASYTILDNLTLAGSTSSINTVEIPEFKDAGGAYYDLRDAIDFRPIVANTVAISTTTGGAPINPAYGTTFVAGDDKFPIPNSVLRTDVEFYEGRTDRIVVDKQGEIRVLKGDAGTYQAPALPKDCLNINVLQIPPYPSLSERLSPNMIAFADKRIDNTDDGSLRANLYTAVLQQSAATVFRGQPRGYSMSDIGDLEKRISDLEYYVALTLAETDVKNKVIPGLGGVDRYKFGFLVDSFNDTGTADLGHSEFNADIIDGRLQSKIDTTVLQQDIESVVQFPYIEFGAYSQLTATDGPVPQPATTTTTTTPRPTTTTTTTTTPRPTTTTPRPTTVAPQPTQRTVCQVVALYGQQFKNDCTVFEETEFLFSSSAGLAEFLFCFEDATGVVEVYYGSAPGFSTAGLTPKYTSATAVALTNAEKSKLTTTNITVFPEVALAANIAKLSVCSGKQALDYSLGKISWSHNPQWGRYVKVKIIKYKIYDEWFRENVSAKKWRNHPPFAYLACYPSDSTATASDITSNPTPVVFDYKGVASVSPATFTIQNTTTTTGTYGPGVTFAGPTGLGYTGFGIAAPGVRYTTVSTIDSQTFTVTVWGLKPLTTHTFVFDGTNQTSKCRAIIPQGDPKYPINIGVLGGGLCSDSSGTLIFEFFYDAGIDEGASTYTDRVRIAGTVIGNKTFTVASSDGISKATGTISIKSYSADTTVPIATTPVVTSVAPTINNVVTAPTTTTTINVNGGSFAGGGAGAGGGLRDGFNHNVNHH